MRRHRTIRVLLIPALAAPLALTALFATGGSAWARGQNLPVSCVGMTGNSGGTLSLNGCTHPDRTGSQGTITLGPSQNYPTSPATITWSPGTDRSNPPLVTTIKFKVIWIVRRERCGAGAYEFKMMGSVSGNSVSPGVKGRVKLIECDTDGLLSDLSPSSIRF